VNSTNLPAHFQSFSFLTQSDWVGKFADGKTTDYQHFEWQHGGKFLRNRHHSTGERGGHEGEAVFAYDEEAQRVRFWYWDITGGVSIGHITVHGEELHAEEDYRGEQSYKMRSIWKQNEEGYESQQFAWQDGEWQPLWTVSYRRK
jgi:hypothetical protein